MTDEEVQEVKALIEATRSRPPTYDPEGQRQLRMADLLLRAVNQIHYPEVRREDDDTLRMRNEACGQER